MSLYETNHDQIVLADIAETVRPFIPAIMLCGLSTDLIKSFLFLAAQSLGREVPNERKSSHPPQT